MGVKKISKLMIIGTLIGVTTLGFVGCGKNASTPKAVVNGYFNELSKGNQEKASEYILRTEEDKKLQEEIMSSEFGNIIEENKPSAESEKDIKEVLSKLKATVTGEEINENKATVDVTVKGPNMISAMKDYFKNYMTEAMMLIFSGEKNNLDTKMEELAKKAEPMLMEEIKKAPEEERTGKLSLDKVEEQWKIKFDGELFNLVLGKLDLNLQGLNLE